MNYYLERLLSLPKSFYVSGRLAGWKNAYKLPICVRFNSLLKDLSGEVLFESEIQSKMLLIGFGEIGIFDKSHSRTILEIKGKMILHGKAFFGHGSKISIGPKGSLYIGRDVCNTAEGTFVCFNKISIEDNTSIGWNALITDNDFHSLENTETHQLYPTCGEIHIGKGAWICARSVVLKNSYIPEGCIVAANSTICKKYTERNCLLAGTPAMPKRHNIRRSTIGDILT